MAHDCPTCDQMCYCDQEDTYLPPPRKCDHECDPEPDDGDYPDNFDDYYPGLGTSRDLR